MVDTCTCTEYILLVRFSLAWMSSTLGNRRKQLTSNQKKTLMKRFQANPHLESEEKCQLAKSVNISEERVAVWFYNKRATNRSKNDGLFCQSEHNYMYVKYLSVRIIGDTTIHRDKHSCKKISCN